MLQWDTCCREGEGDIDVEHLSRIHNQFELELLQFV